MNARELVLRADASEAIGTGHVMRGLALAQAWIAGGGSATFAMAECPPSLCERLRDEGANIVSIRAPRASLDDAEETAGRARDLDARWVWVDGYDFDTGFQRALRTRGLSVALVDDDALAERFDADLVLNGNAYATLDLYAHKAESARLALGGRYTLLRGEFSPWRLWRREIPDRARRILITTGGSDPRDAAGTLLRAFERLPREGLEIQLIVGAANANRARLERQAASIGARVIHDVRHMPECMAWADLAISAAGSTSWEMAYMGLPALTVVIADNQERIARCLADRGAARPLGRVESLDVDVVAAEVHRMVEDANARTTLSRAGRRLIDGRGAARAADLMREVA